MSRLHSLRSPVAEVAARFAVADMPALVIPSEVTEGRTGVAIFEANGERRMRAMRWGFTRRGHAVGEPDLIGLVADLTNPLWEETVVDPRYRCIIPMTHFANPEGEPGRKRRTWFSVHDQPVMAWAGFCRNLPDIGPVYAGMTMEANAAIPPTNDRMPALLEYDEIDRWLHGSIRDVIGFQFRRPFAAERMDVIRTDDAWRSGEPPPTARQARMF